MPSWNDLLAEIATKTTDAEVSAWLIEKTTNSLEAVSQRRKGQNVLFYATAFLQKPHIPQQFLQLTHEEINGFMSCIYGMDCSKGLTLILHTPGGVTNAAESVVSYLWSKFTDIEVVIPTYAMSAGTMIALSANRLVMGRQSQLGPIDPQMPLGNNYVSARAVVDQFARARKDIIANRDTAHVWAPILQSLGPSVLQEAQNALDYGERMVALWLRQRMLAGEKFAANRAKKAAHYFNDASRHKSHGRRIDRDEARKQRIRIEDLESDQQLQEAVLTAYHLMTITFEKSPAAKVLFSNHGRLWVKNFGAVGPPQP